MGTGLFLTIRLLFVQVRHLGHAMACVMGKYDQPGESGDVSHFKALATALSATIGTGNIADIFNALMAIPNLIGLLLLSGVLARET